VKQEDIVDFFLIYASKLNFSGSCKKIMFDVDDVGSAF